MLNPDRTGFSRFVSLLSTIMLGILLVYMPYPSYVQDILSDVPSACTENCDTAQNISEEDIHWAVAEPVRKESILRPVYLIHAFHPHLKGVFTGSLSPPPEQV